MEELPPSCDLSAVKAPSQPNRRSHSRYACEGRAEVYLPHGGLLLRGRILDLSLSGCFVETAAMNLERGTRVEAYFTTRRLQFRVAGIVAAHHKRGAGIAFQELSPRNVGQIADLVRELKEATESS